MPRRAYAQALLNKIFSCTEALATSGDVKQVFLPPLCPAPYLLLACVCMACMEWRGVIGPCMLPGPSSVTRHQAMCMRRTEREGGTDGRTEGGREGVREGERERKLGKEGDVTRACLSPVQSTALVGLLSESLKALQTLDALEHK